MKRSQILTFFQISLASVLAMMLFFTTRYGLGLSPDSIAYLKGAEGLIMGRGTEYMSVQWPPLYPTMLAIIGKIVNKDLMLGARLLNTALFAINYLLIANLIINYIKLNKIAAYILAFLISLHEVLIFVGFYAWSETLVITAILADLIIIEKYINRKSKKIELIEILLILCATVAVFTRYIGVIVGVLNAIVVVANVDIKNISKRFAKGFIQAIIPITLIIPWLKWHKAIDDNNATERGIQLHLIDINKITDGFINIGRWLYPSSSKYEGLVPTELIFITGLIVVTMVLIQAVRVIILIIKSIYKKDEKLLIVNKRKNLFGIVGIFILLYILFLITTISFVDRKLLLDNRFLAPIFIPIIVFILGCISTLKKINLRLMLYLAFTAVMLFSYMNLRSWLLINYFDGVELNSRSYINKKIYKNLHQYSKSCQIYSDQPWNMALYFEPKVRWLPTKILFGTGLDNKTYKEEIASLKRTADLIVVENINDPIMNDIDELKEFNKIYDEKDGVIWKKNNLEKCYKEKY